MNSLHKIQENSKQRALEKTLNLQKQVYKPITYYNYGLQYNTATTNTLTFRTTTTTTNDTIRIR